MSKSILFLPELKSNFWKIHLKFYQIWSKLGCFIHYAYKICVFYFSWLLTLWIVNLKHPSLHQINKIYSCYFHYEVKDDLFFIYSITRINNTSFLSNNLFVFQLNCLDSSICGRFRILLSTVFFSNNSFLKVDIPTPQNGSDPENETYFK